MKKVTIYLLWVFFISTFSHIAGAQNLKVNASVSNNTPSTGETLIYEIQYRCASLTDHCYDAHITFTLPDALKLKSPPAVGGNVSSVGIAGNSVDISLASPAAVGAPPGALQAGSSGAISFYVEFICGENGVGAVPSVGSIVDFTAGPIFSTITDSEGIDISTTAITVPLVEPCPPVPPMTPPANSITKTLAGETEPKNHPRDAYASYYTFTFPSFPIPPDPPAPPPPPESVSYTIVDDWDGENLQIRTNITSINPAMVTEVKPIGDNNWYTLSHGTYGWSYQVADGAPLNDENGDPIPGVFNNIHYDPKIGDQPFASGLDSIRWIVTGSPDSPFPETTFSSYIWIEEDADIGAYTNCLTSDNTNWPPSCADEFYVFDKPLLRMRVSNGVYFDVGATSLAASVVLSESDTPSPYPDKEKDPLDAAIRINIQGEQLEGGLTQTFLLPDGFDYFLNDPDIPNFWYVYGNNTSSPFAL
ncbi:MAG: hypothetical protein R2795_11515 [Saprospiraceae bacterium]